MQTVTEMAHFANRYGTNGHVCSGYGLGVPQNPCRNRVAMPRKSQSERRPCTVYFVTARGVPDYPIKIGMTTRPVEKRLKSLQTSCPYELYVIATVEGTSAYEWVLHVDLAQHRLEGEWFKRHPDVLKEVYAAQKKQAAYDRYNRRWKRP